MKLFIAIGGLTRVFYELASIVFGWMLFGPTVGIILLGWYVIWSISGMFVFAKLQTDMEEQERLKRVKDIWGGKADFSHMD